ncbi:hypothetical protein E8E11_004239 [Didymella keratinophila]|nr:hypothetical protein E8E11_004239 [Didymella keratinophila]
MSSSSTFFNEECLKEYVQKLVNAANKETTVRVEDLTTRLKQQTQREFGLLDTLRKQRNDFGSLEAAFAGLKESHHTFVLSSNKKISALQLVMQKDNEVRQEGPKKLLNRFENRVELLTSQTTDTKTEMGNIVRRVDDIDSATARNKKRLQTTEEAIQNGGVQLRRDLSELNDKVKRVDTLVDRDHKIFTHKIKDANNRYASLSTKVNATADRLPKIKASMVTYTDEQFAKAVAHTDHTAQKHLSAHARHTEAASKSLSNLQRSYIELKAVFEAVPQATFKDVIKNHDQDVQRFTGLFTALEHMLSGLKRTFISEQQRVNVLSAAQQDNMVNFNDAFRQFKIFWSALEHVFMWASKMFWRQDQKAREKQDRQIQDNLPPGSTFTPAPLAPFQVALARKGFSEIWKSANRIPLEAPHARAQAQRRATLAESPAGTQSHPRPVPEEAPELLSGPGSRLRMALDLRL